LQTALERQIEALFDAKPARYTEEDRTLFRAFKEDLNAGRVRSAEPDPSQKKRLANQYVGEEGHSCGFPHGDDRRYVDRSRKAAVLRQRHIPGAAFCGE